MAKVLLAFVLSLVPFVAFAQSAAGPSFPRLALYSIGSPHNYENAQRQSQYARFDLVILNVWPNWESGRGTTMEQVVRSVKSQNANTKVFLYVANNEFDDTWTVWPEVRAKLDAEQWWAYQSGGSGTRAKSTWGNTHYLINNTQASRRDASGRTFPEWYAQYIVDRFYRPNPSIDGFFLDNVFWKPRVDADWDRDGTTDAQGGETARRLTQQGLKRHFEVMQSLMPGKLQIGNVADWGGPETDLRDITGVVQGGLMEHLIGTPYSPERWSGWTGTMNFYRKTKSALTGPQITIFHQEGSPTGYKDFRFGLATCLMDDGYYFFSPGNFHDIVWFDEFDNDLGQAISAPPTGAWQKGVYRRDFEKGIALVNPPGNGAQDITLEGDFTRIAGSQDPSVNNGQSVRTLRLQERDGIILLRNGARARPAAPADVRVE
jgi:hypothetical protein